MLPISAIVYRRAATSRASVASRCAGVAGSRSGVNARSSPSTRSATVVGSPVSAASAVDSSVPCPHRPHNAASYDQAATPESAAIATPTST